MEAQQTQLNTDIRIASVETVHEALELGIIDEVTAIARIVQLIEQAPQGERAALVEALREDPRRETQVAVSEWEWGSK